MDHDQPCLSIRTCPLLLCGMTTPQSSTQMFQCEHCEFKSNRKDSLARHLVKHSESRKRKLEPEPEKSKRKKYSDDEMDVDIPNLPNQVEDMMEEIDLNELFNLTDSVLQRILELDPEDSRTEKEIEPEKEKFPEQVEDNLEDMIGDIDLNQILNLTDSHLQRIQEQKKN